MLLLLSITISFQQSCLKMAILKYLHKAILKLHAQVIDIVCVLSHFICVGSLEFPSLCSAQCHMQKKTTRAVSDFRLQRLLSYCIMTADPSQPLQQQMQHGKLSAWIFADNR